MKTRREVALRPAIVRIVDRMTLMSGTLEFPCLPGLLDHVQERVLDLLAEIGRSFSSEEINTLRRLLSHALDEGYRKSSDSRVLIEITAPEGKIANYKIAVRPRTTEERFETLASVRPPPLFGNVPDAMVLDTAATLGEPSQIRVLDVGAGTGRNAFPLARLGHPVTAVEPIATFAEQIRANAEQLPLSVLVQDFLSADATVESGRFGLVVASEVLTHFRRIEDIRTAFIKFAEALSPGGVVVANVFIANHWYKPDPLARQVAEMSWSCLYTPSELELITAELPFEKIADECALDYEREHLPPKDWPPTAWYEDWANGRNVFETSPGMSPPIELRWLVFRRLP